MVRGSAAKIQVSADISDLFKSTGSASALVPDGQTVVRIPIDQLHPFPNQPFKLYGEKQMQEMVEDVRKIGVHTPIQVRMRPDGDGYEIIAGHNRVEASRLAGKDSVPALVDDLDDEAAIIRMVDSNLNQRQQILPSEKAFAFKMKMEALCRQGARTDLTSPQVAAKFRSDDEVAKEAGISGDTVRRYVSLTHLIPELLERVDAGKMAFSPAVALSHLAETEQQDLFKIMQMDEVSPSLEQAEALKAMSPVGLNYEAIHAIMRQEKGNQRSVVKVDLDRLH